MNDRTAQEKRLEQLAAGCGTICEYTQGQLEKLNNFTNIVRGIESTIIERHRTIEHLQKMIVAQQEREAAEAAIDEPIKNFNRCSAELKRIWEDLKATANEHDIELPQQEVPGGAFLFEGQKRLGSSPYVHWLTIAFQEE